MILIVPLVVFFLSDSMHCLCARKGDYGLRCLSICGEGSEREKRKGNEGVRVKDEGSI